MLYQTPAVLTSRRMLMNNLLAVQARERWGS